jgi:uncharacterized protein (DUF697 family)
MLGALIGGSVSASATPSLAGLTRMIPVIGPTVAAITMPLVAGASTYAVGKVFIQHFESGAHIFNI